MFSMASGPCCWCWGYWAFWCGCVVYQPEQGSSDLPGSTRMVPIQSSLILATGKSSWPSAVTGCQGTLATANAEKLPTILEGKKTEASAKAVPKGFDVQAHREWICQRHQVILVRVTLGGGRLWPRE
eukprot:s117_g10.t1